MSILRPYSVLTSLIFIAGCSIGGPTLAESTIAPKPASEFSSDTSFQMYHVMAAELLAKNNQFEQALAHYQAAAKGSKSGTLFQSAVEMAFRAKDMDAAKELLNAWLEVDPESMEGHRYRLLHNVSVGRYEDTVEDAQWIAKKHEAEGEEDGFQQVVSMVALSGDFEHAYQVTKQYAAKVDDSPKIQLVLAALAISAKREKEALDPALIARENGDEVQQEQARKLRSKAMVALGDQAAALAELEPLAESGSSDIRLEYARLLIVANRREEAKPLFKKLYADEPDNIDVLYTLGLLYLEKGEYAYAEPLMRKLLEEPKRKNEAHYFLAQVYEGQKDFEQAAIHYQEALKGVFANEAIGHMSKMLKKSQGVDAAVAWLDKSIGMTDEPVRRFSLLMAKAQLFHDEGDYAKAVTLYDEAEKTGTSLRDVRYARALSYDRLNKIAEAEKDLRAIIEETPDDHSALNALGYMLSVSTDRYEEAHDLIAQAIELDPNSPAIMDSMGWALFKLGKIDQALTWLQKAFDLFPDPEVGSHLVEALHKSGKVFEAQTLFKSLIEKHPDDPLLSEIKARLVELQQ